MDRRQFIKWGSFMTISTASATVLTACGGGDDNHGNGAPATGGAPGNGNTPAPGFSLGVASGDPRPDSVILWTRVDGGDGAQPMNVRVQVSKTNDFQSLVVDTTVPVLADWDYTLRHKVTGLTAGTVYFYRFSVAGVTSMTGRTWTAPAAGQSTAQLKFAFMACQDWGTNHWAAFDAMQAEDIDFVVHLGSYIHEQLNRPAVIQQPAEAAHAPITLPDGTKLPDGSVYATTLRDYRTLYKTYRTDARLQKIHANWPMIAMWGDHEFSDDAWQDHQTYATDDSAPQTARRRNANQAWFEYMPADVSLNTADTSFQNIQLYRAFTFGDLATLVMTDERLYRADHMITEQSAGGALGSRYVVGRDAVATAETGKMTAAGGALTPVSMLGDTQRTWWQDQMSTASTVWKLWGNEVPLARVQFDNLDQVINLLTQSVVSADASLASAGPLLKPKVAADIAEAVTGNLHPAPFTQLRAFGQTAHFPAATIEAFVAALNQMLPPYEMLTTLLISADQWDGYNAERKDMMAFLANGNIGNVVSLSGNLNAFVASTVMDDYDTTKQPVMVDLTTAGISAPSLFNEYVSYLNSTAATQAWLSPLLSSGALPPFGTLLKQYNTWLSYVDADAQGYAVVTLTPTKLSCTFKKLAPLSGTQAPVGTAAIASTQEVSMLAGAIAITVA